MLAATGCATAVLLLASATATGPGPAMHSSLAVPTTGLPPTTGFGTSVTDSGPIGRTLRDWLKVTEPSVALNKPVSLLATGTVLIENVFVVAPEGTVTVAAALAAANVSLSVITVPLAGAGPEIVTLPARTLQPATSD